MSSPLDEYGMVVSIRQVQWAECDTIRTAPWPQGSRLISGRCGDQPGRPLLTP